MRSKKDFWFLLFLCAAYTIAWGYACTLNGFWGDEEWTAVTIHMDWRPMLHRIRYDVYPPLYFILVKVWHGATGWMGIELSLRSFSVLLGAAGLPVYFLLFRKFQPKGAAPHAAVLMMSLAPFLTWYSTEAKNYALLITLFGAAWLSLLHLLEKPRSRTLIITLAALLTAVAHTHIIGLLGVGAIGAYVAWQLLAGKINSRQLAAFSIALAVAVLIYAPQWHTTRNQMSGHRNFWALRPPWNPLEVWISLFPDYFGLTPGVSGGILALFAGTLSLWAPRQKGKGPDFRAALWCVAFGYLLFPWFASQYITPFLIPRATLPLVPFLYLSLSRAVETRLGTKGMALMLALLAPSWIGTWGGQHLGADREDIRGAVEYISANARPGDVVIRNGFIGDYYLKASGLTLVDDKDTVKGRYWLIQRFCDIGSCRLRRFCPGKYPREFRILAERSFVANAAWCSLNVKLVETVFPALSP